MITRSGKLKLLLVTLLALAALSGCGRTVTVQVAPSCGAVSSPSTPTPDDGVQGPGHSESIVTGGDAAYVGSDDGSIYAFSAATCTPLWQRHLFSQQAGVFAISDGLVYASNAIQPAPIYALSAATGKILWQFSQADAVGFKMAVQDGVVFADGQSSGDHETLTALRASDGHVLWQDAPSPPLQLPELMGAGAGVVYIRQAMGQNPDLLSRSTISALDTQSGRVLWTAALAGSDGAAAGAPVESGGVLYVETTTGALYALRAASGMRVWHIAGPQVPLQGSPYELLTPVVADGLVYTGGFAGVAAYREVDGSLAWRYQPTAQGPFPSLPALVSGVIYVGTGVGEFGYLVALRASDGTILWKHQDLATPNFGPLLVAGGLLISNGNSGPAHALRMSDGSQVWKSSYMPEGGWFTSFGPPEALGADASGAGVLYIGSADGVVHALRVDDGRQLWESPVA